VPSWCKNILSVESK